MDHPSLTKRAAAEAIGTAFLLAAVVAVWAADVRVTPLVADGRVYA